MSRVPTVRKADLDRALRAIAAAGLGVAEIRVRPGGEIIITPGPKPNTAAPLTPEAEPAPPADLDQWRARKNGRRAAQGHQ